MGCRKIAASGVALVLTAGSLLTAGALLAVGGPAVASASTPTAATACPTTTDDAWPAWVQGRPAGIDPATAAGAYMWHDGTGWHLRVTHRTDARRTFGGRLVTRGRFVGVSAVRLEGGDVLSVSADHHVVAFRFVNYGHVDGLDFRTLCAPAIGFAFSSDGSVLAPAKVTIGHAGAHPATDPFSISRT